MPRAIIIVLDSVGIGGAPDAAEFADEGANTFGSVVRASHDGRADRDGLRSGPLEIPNLDRLGLYHAAGLQTDVTAPEAAYGSAREISRGKDTICGHWEIAGAPVTFEWGRFPKTEPAFPASLIRQIMDDTRIPGILGDKHASGTEILVEYGEDSVRTGKPIFYTSSDSVLQIAAHEEHFGLERLMKLCEVARAHCDPLNIGRVIARPFLGEDANSFKRTANRRDFSIPSPNETLVDRVTAADHTVYAVGKIADIFAHRGIGRVLKGDDNMANVDRTLEAMGRAGDGDLVFTNLVDFDTEYGHRRDPAGYAHALEAFDARLPEIESALKSGDLVIITADHGCDPTYAGTEHTRERVPILAFGPDVVPRDLGERGTYADIGASVAVHLGIEPGRHGTPFL